jgi:hypothetical protein
MRIVPRPMRADERRSPLRGEKFALIGGFESFPRRRLVWEIERRGGRCVPRGLGTASVAVLGHGVAAQADTGELTPLLARAAARGCTVVSEHGFLRRLGLLPPLPHAFRMLSLEDLARRAGLPLETLGVLRLLDLVEDDGGCFEFRDLVAARGVARLLAAGASFAAIADGATRLRRGTGDEHPLARAHLVCAPPGEVVLRFGRYVAEADGQLRLPIGDGGNPALGALLDAAGEADEAGELDLAERLYQRCLRADPGDSCARFNLADLLRRGERRAESRRLLRELVAREPTFVDAWCALAGLAESDAELTEVACGLEAIVAGALPGAGTAEPKAPRLPGI